MEQARMMEYVGWLGLSSHWTTYSKKDMQQDRSLMYRKCVPRVRGLSSKFVNGWGFMLDYHNWTYDGEALGRMNVKTNVSTAKETSSSRTRESSTYHEMIFDVAGPSVDPNLSNYTYEEAPNLEAQKFYDMLKSRKTSLYEGCTRSSQLSATAELLNIKSENNSSEKSFDQVAQHIKRLLSENNKVVDS
ncbi:hypothetical protein M9H77_03624 [Catharanthus roseus]|uniref:Uncharacterized protein n=1 Tax=Catharanthus roseus TaxID=4058 RepID=A0ACC0CBV4_CATRO|nr:hypothetical protein M9H77_03624 [Catharanthus roseus]